MGKLREWADKQTPYIKLEDGQSIIGEYLGYKFKTSNFDPTKDVVVYMLLVDGEEKTFESGAGNVARAFDEIGANEIVKISKSGTGPKTKYTITRMPQAQQTSMKDPAELG